MIKQYDSIADLRADAIRLDCAGGLTNNADDHWCGETKTETLSRSQFGHTDMVPQAEILLSQLDTEIEVPRKRWEPSVAGAFACVPDHIRGLPTSMRRRIDDSSDHNPIRIFAITTSSAGIDAKTIQERGIAILALAIALARIRPLSLYATSILDGHVDDTGECLITAEINTHPLDLATACYVLTGAGFDRRLFHGLAWRYAKYSGRWPKNYYENKSKYHEYLKRVLSPNLEAMSQTIIISEAYLTDPLITSPIRWLNDQIKHFTGDQDGTP